MTNRDAALLAFKLLGLWLMANAAIGVAALPYYWDSRFEGGRSFAVFVTLLPLLVAVGIGVPVWFAADWFADRIFPAADRDLRGGDSLGARQLLALAMSVLGLLFVCEALPILVNGVALFSQSRVGGSSVLGPDTERRALIWSAAAKASFAGGLARLLIGIGLLLGPGRLGAILAGLRKELSGSPAEEEPPAAVREAADTVAGDEADREEPRR